MSKESEWPDLLPHKWRDTYGTLHMWTQIVGKTRLALAPPENHCWQVALYLTARGLTTSPMPSGDRTVAVDFDFISHRLLIETSAGTERSLPLAPMSVADFFAEYKRALFDLGIDAKIYPTPVEVETAIPFSQDRRHAAYDPDIAHRCWQILASTQSVMQSYRGGFAGKQSPAHFFWGSFDLASTRFSGRRAPRHPGGVLNCPDRVMIEAYSHECASCGFWPGDGDSRPAAFYAYAYPEPSAYAAQRVEPEAAHYDRQAREFLLPYDSLRTSPTPDDALLRFFQTTYEAAANLGRWDRASLDRLNA